MLCTLNVRTVGIGVAPIRCGSIALTTLRYVGSAVKQLKAAYNGAPSSRRSALVPKASPSAKLWMARHWAATYAPPPPHVHPLEHSLALVAGRPPYPTLESTKPSSSSPSSPHHAIKIAIHRRSPFVSAVASLPSIHRNTYSPLVARIRAGISLFSHRPRYHHDQIHC